MLVYCFDTVEEEEDEDDASDEEVNDTADEGDEENVRCFLHHPTPPLSSSNAFLSSSL